MTDLWRLSATDLAARIRSRTVSAREAAEAALTRLDAVNPRLNAVVMHRPEAVRSRADAIDAAIARGEDPGLLAGVPVTVKVNADQAGFATTNGLVQQKDLIAASNSPVVDNLEHAGAVIIGRTNTPAFSLRWFTTNLVHGDTRNPRNPALTPGGSSGGAASAVAAGIGHLAHGTDIGGSVRYPAYACGVHGLRPSLGRIPAWNSSSPERGIGPQLMAVSGPLARTIADVRLGLQAMMRGDARDPWWIPVPFDGPAAPKRVALCLRPDGMAIVPEVEAALLDAAKRLERAGYEIVPLDTVPDFRESTALQMKLWLGDGWAGFRAAVEREGDPGALAVMHGVRAMAESLPPDVIATTLVRRNAITRDWTRFLADYPLLLVPVSGELPFADGLDMQGEAAWSRVLEAQLIQTGLPLMGLPGLVVSTGMSGSSPVGIQLIGQRYREDLMLDAGAAIEAGGAPPMPAEPA
ncbi:MAG: amidase family protein [Janthinobacterium lividum]